MRKPVRDVLNATMRFMDACKRIPDNVTSEPNRERAAALRASLDLSRALTEFRKPWPDRD